MVNNNNNTKKTSVTTRRSASSASRRENNTPAPDYSVENFPPLPAPAAPRGRMAATNIPVLGGTPSEPVTSKENDDEFMEIDELYSSAPLSNPDNSETPVFSSEHTKQPECFEDIETNVPVDIKTALNDRMQALRDQIGHKALQISVISDLVLLKSMREQLAEMRERLNELEGTYKDMYSVDEPVVNHSSSSSKTRDEVMNSSILLNQGHLYQPMSFVPSNLPFFQWTGFVHDNSRRVYKTPNQCIRAFEQVLLSHSLSLEENWLRILPITAPEQIMDWVNEFLETNPNASWTSVKEALSTRFGMSPERTRQLATDSLYRLAVHRNESMHQYVERFRRLVREAQLNDEPMRKYCLLKPIEAKTHAAVLKTISLSEDPNKDSLDYMIRVLLSIDDAENNIEVLKKMGSHRKMHGPKKFSQPRFSPSSRLGRSHQEAFTSQPRSKAYCHVHDTTAHDIQDCKAYKRRVTAMSSNKSKASSSKRCHKCNKPWNSKHVCKSSSSPSSSSGRNRTKTKKPRPPVPVPSEDEDERDNSSDEDHNLNFAAADFAPEGKGKGKADCKSTILKDEYFAQSPKNLLADKFIYLPLTIESVKTWALLDSGCSFSSISPTLARHLNLEINKSRGNIKLVNGNTVRRMGKTHKKLEVTYNFKSMHSHFEVFDLFNNIHVCIGMDLLYLLGIEISNIAMSWDDQVGPSYPAIDPSPATPNNDPYGTADEREHMSKSIEPFIKANRNIPVANYCNIPGSEIRLPLKANADRPYSRQYEIKHCHIDAVQNQIKEWIEGQVIEEAPPNNPYNSSLLTVLKRSPITGEPDPNKVRTVLDCRKVNQNLDPAQMDKFPLPLISTLHRQLSKYTLFTTIDLSACFHSFRIRRRDRPVTSFTAPNGKQYQFKRAPFGLLNVSSVVQRSITSLFADLDYCVHYIDDIYVATDTNVERHIRCLQTVLTRLTNANLRINHEKLNLMQNSIFVLGFRLSHEALTLDMRKVSNVLSWPDTVQNSKELSHRLGVINYFREHVPRIATLMAPLNALKNHPNIKEVWTKEHSQTMRTLQRVLACTPVLSCPNLKHPLHLVTDASAYGIGGCLYQVIDKEIRYIGFVARTLSKTERGYGVSRRELLAFLYCTTKWKKWLSGHKFHYHTDNKGILHLHTKAEVTPIIENYYEKIFEFDFDITFCAGVRNVLADHLSRLLYPDEDAEKLAEGNKQKAPEKKICQATDSENKPDHGSTAIESSSLSEKVNTNDATDRTIAASRIDKYSQPQDDAHKTQIIAQCHLAGHYGINSVENMIKREHGMNWKHLREDVTEYIKNCTKCARFNLAKHVFHPPKSDAPNNTWDKVAIDLGTFDVTTPRGNNYLLVCVDIFSRFVILRAIKSKTALDVAKELIQIFSIMGYPKVLQHDRGLEFYNELLKGLRQHMGIEPALSLPYTPAGNLETHVKTAKSIILKMLDGYEESWDLYVEGTMYLMNQHTSRLHNHTPFQVMFNRQANDLKDYTKALSKMNISDDMIDTDKLKKEIERFNNYTIPEIRNQIIQTQKKDNEYFVKKHRVLKDPFPIGAKVMIKNIENKRRKTDANYEGPFYVHGYTKNGSYILTDRTGSILSRNIPTSQIKLIANETNKSDENKDIYEVQAVINHREVEPNGIEYLTTWIGYPDEQTWQKPEDFDSPEPIKEYWKRRNANKPTKTGQIKKIKGTHKRKMPFKESNQSKQPKSSST